MNRSDTCTQPNRGVVLFDDLVSNPEAETGAEFRTGSKKRIKDTRQVVARDSMPMIAHHDADTLPTAEKAQVHVAARRRRLGGIQDEIGHYLLNLAGPAVDFEGDSRDFRVQSGGGAPDLLLEHRQELPNAVGQVEALSAVALPVKGKRLAGHSTQAGELRLDGLQKRMN